MGDKIFLNDDDLEDLLSRDGGRVKVSTPGKNRTSKIFYTIPELQVLCIVKQILSEKDETDLSEIEKEITNARGAASAIYLPRRYVGLIKKFHKGKILDLDESVVRFGQNYDSAFIELNNSGHIGLQPRRALRRFTDAGNYMYIGDHPPTGTNM